ncbi:MAG: urease accessory protein UreD [Fulvimarina manganoxydans]|uniref:urease accessory protein UreD n=1 Tax=Fulvimarina manganoxydans TaxID=937218 RepID=UPI0023533F3B|nr:urease accessory protein UreD [Fulvimarina manganoxydans]MCK5932571.1 urease accessory protein UreD [Fulvimarina manganoxydans]
MPPSLLARCDDGAETAALQRARGSAEARVRRLGEQTKLADLRQEGCLKLRFPRLPQPSIEAVLINTSGGLTGGDRLTQAFHLDAGAALTVTTQACERVYRASGGQAEVATQLSAESGAHLAYLPQETILFEGGVLSRHLDVDLAEGAEALLCEPVILGREAMGETLCEAFLADRWRVRIAGRLVYADALRLGPDIARVTAAAAGLGGARAFASLLLVSPRAEALIGEVREIIGDRGGASLVEGCLVIRLVAEGGFALRKTMVPLLNRLAIAPLPRIWSL